MLIGASFFVEYYYHIYTHAIIMDEASERAALLDCLLNKKAVVVIEPLHSKFIYDEPEESSAENTATSTSMIQDMKPLSTLPTDVLVSLFATSLKISQSTPGF